MKKSVSKTEKTSVEKRLVIVANWIHNAESLQELSGAFGRSGNAM